MAKDFTLDDTNDLIIRKGDFLLSEAIPQDVSLIVTANTGEFKQYPLLGVGFVKKIRSNLNIEILQQDINTQLQIDNFTDIYIETADNQIKKIAAKR